MSPLNVCRIAGTLVAAVLAVPSVPSLAQPIQLLEPSNRPLIPQGESAKSQAETSSLVYFASTGCDNGCVLLGYGSNGSASLMQGALDCLGQPDCLKPVPLAADAPGGKVSGVKNVIGIDGSVKDTPGGKLENGVCTGGSPSTQDEFLSGGGTDNVVARAPDGVLLFMRAGIRLFADAKADCALDLRVGDLGFGGSPESGSFRQVNVVYRSQGDGTTWPKEAASIVTGVAAGDPWTHSALDRFELFTNPFDGTLYASGGAGTGPRGVNTSQMFASTNAGATWVKRASPFDNAYGAYVPLALAATKQRLYAAVCADGVYPPVRLHPVLGWSDDGGKKWFTSEGDALSDLECDNSTPLENLAGGGYAIPNTVAIAPLHSSSKGEVVRLAFTHRRTGSPNLPEGLLGIADHQELIVVNVTVTPSGGTSVSPVTTVRVPNFGSVVRAGFVRADPGVFDDQREANPAVLWWLESDHPGFTKPARMRAKFMVSYGAEDWTAPQPLAVVAIPSGGPPTPVEWTHAAGNVRPGDYDNGSFYRRDGRLNFLIQWPQDAIQTDAAGNVLSVKNRIHYNIVSVAPKPPPPENLLTNVGVVLLDELLPGHTPTLCLSCPPAELTFLSRVAGLVSVEVRHGRRVLDRFRVDAVPGVNVVSIGSRRGSPLVERGRVKLELQLRAPGQRLVQQVDGVARRRVAIRRGGERARPSEPTRVPQ